MDLGSTIAYIESEQEDDALLSPVVLAESNVPQQDALPVVDSVPNDVIHLNSVAESPDDIGPQESEEVTCVKPKFDVVTLEIFDNGNLGVVCEMQDKNPWMFFQIPKNPKDVVIWGFRGGLRGLTLILMYCTHVAAIKFLSLLITILAVFLHIYMHYLDIIYISHLVLVDTGSIYLIYKSSNDVK